MSGSPKHTRAEIAAAHRERLRELRRIEEEKERTARLESARRQLSTRLRSELEDMRLRWKSLSTKLAMESPHNSDRQFEEFESRLSRTSTPEALSELKQTTTQAIANLERKLTEARQARRLEALRNERAEAREELGRLRQHLQQIEGQSTRFDASGRSGVLSKIEHALSSVAGSAIPQRLLERVATAMAEHERVIRREHDRWTAARTAADQKVAHIEAELAGLEGDLLVNRWSRVELQALKEMLNEARAAIEAERYSVVDELESKFHTAQESLVAFTSERQLKEDERHKIADGMTQALEAMGFYTSDPKLQDEHESGSDLLILAQKANGQKIGVSVPMEGEVSYDVAGYAMSSAEGLASCDQAEDALEHLHKLLAQLGIETNGLRWEGKGDRPDRRLVSEKDLPSGNRVREAR